MIVVVAILASGVSAVLAIGFAFRRAHRSFDERLAERYYLKDAAFWVHELADMERRSKEALRKASREEDLLRQLIERRRTLEEHVWGLQSRVRELEAESQKAAKAAASLTKE